MIRSPSGAVEQVTLAGIRLVPAATVSELKAGSAVDRAVEVMIGDGNLPAADGILSQGRLAGTTTSSRPRSGPLRYP